MQETTYCANHPNTASKLRCGRCEAVVCPRCMVHAPVGMRCPDCAQLRRLPTYEVTGGYLARALATGLALAAGTGVALALLSPVLHRVPFLDTIAIAGAGYLIGWTISAAVNRKRGRTLKLVAGGAALVAFSIMWLFGVPSLSIFSLLAGLAAVYLATSHF